MENKTDGIEMPKRLIEHLEGNELSHEELTGEAIVDEKETPVEKKLENIDDIVEDIKNEYGVESIPEGFVNMAATQLENKLKNPEINNTDAVEQTRQYLLEKLKLSENDEEFLKQGKIFYQQADSLVNAYKNNKASYTEAMNKIVDAEDNLKKVKSNKAEGMLNYLKSWKDEITELFNERS